MRSGKGKFQNRSKYGANRAVHSVWDIGRLTPVEGVVEVESSPKSIAEMMQRERQALQQRQLAEQQIRDNAALAEHDTRLTAYWSQQPASALMASPVGVRDDFSGLATGDSVPNAGLDFLTELEQSGVRFTMGFKQRLGKYMESQNKHVGAAVTIANLRQAFERLKSLGCFAAGEVIEPAPVESETPQGPTLAELLARANESPTADRECRSAVAGMVRAEYRDVIEAWQRSVYDNFGHRLTETQIKEAWRFVEHHNLNPLKPASWDSARVNLVHRSLAPSSLLLASDVLNDQLRAGEITAVEHFQRSRTLALEGKLNRPRCEAGHS
jgi:hypothetical protein